MPLSFPSSPTVGQQATTGGRTYQWTGESWQLVGSGIAGPTGAPGASVTGPTGAASTVTGPTGPAGGGSFSWASVPTGSSATGTAGEIAYDSSYLYVRTSSLWKRVALSTWGGDADFANVKLLLHMDGTGANFTDSSTASRTVTAYGDATQSATESKFGGKALYCDGTGDYITVPSSADFDWSAGDAVIEGWIYPTDLSTNRVICSTSSSTDDGATAVYVSPYGQLCVDKIGTSGVSGGGGGGGAPEITTGAWHHFAAVKSGTSTYLYLNGTRIATGTASNAWSSGSAPFSIGKSYWSSASNFAGYIDDLRVTVGANRGYTGSTITVPTAAYLDY